MARILRNLHVTEVSSVDRGAGEGVKVMLMKRDFSGKEREQAADTGAAMPDGGFPIKTTADLANAVQAFGRAKDPEAAKRHIISRARALGAVDKLPGAWNVSKAATNGDVEMTEQEIQALVAKSVADGVKTATAGLAAEIAKRDMEITMLKMSPAQKAYMDACDTEDAKKSFAGMTDEQRDAHMNKNPMRKREDPVTGAEMAKRDETIAKQAAENVELKKRLDAMDLEKAQADFKKRAADLGLTADNDGEIMRKAYAGDAEAQRAFEKRQAETLVALRKQAETGELFAEFGTAKGAGGDAYGQLVAKAEELRKGDSKLTQEQAFTKAYTDPGNKELVKAYKAEEGKRRQGIAA